jgi:hypothetical protein
MVSPVLPTAVRDGGMGGMAAAGLAPDAAGMTGIGVVMGAR